MRIIRWFGSWFRVKRNCQFFGCSSYMSSIRIGQHLWSVMWSPNGGYSFIRKRLPE